MLDLHRSSQLDGRRHDWKQKKDVRQQWGVHVRDDDDDDDDDDDVYVNDDDDGDLSIAKKLISALPSVGEGGTGMSD